ncbi:MAG: ABC transporter substrate-binding protein [Chloroflexi bacterium AL-W]|nr:ABC transporter substrate-binding protein [Chloroflexi bacterium AL-N1]NOK67431.1 ABC transporter substrate-binding protein [Chloroflexi bacterium AL-N10]NOK75077.1 ABC transporter substrate-binding protein [Chloroflexi bacterium AL-N5]NOK81864.1 ABC transporter substrate-binding protein [Chloroflexi bacterium AL-W]NOK89710.1 ABC transporter substrate-binding protein [Chloroflexi bacterium AL-N15]
MEKNTNWSLGLSFKILTLFILITFIAACSGAPAADTTDSDTATEAPVEDTTESTEEPTEAEGETPAEGDAETTDESDATDSSAATADGTYNEAPALAELVAAGDLPPVEERLPTEPMVVEVVDRIGQYGGEWRMGMVGTDDHVLMLKTALYDGLVRWNRDWTDIVPNLAESWEVENEGAKYTFTLREGTKWSDGTPFTSADIMFWVEEILPNPDLTEEYPSWLRVGDEQATITAPDDYTIVFEWSQPNGLFLQNLASPDGLVVTHYQAEYAKQWHIDFNPEVEALAQEEELPSWIELWDIRAGFNTGGINARNQNPELPTLTPWIYTNALGDGDRVRLERNPYYWKIDAEGNQLPYIDSVLYELVTDREVLRLRATAGDWNFQDRRLGGPTERAVYIENQERSGYRFVDVLSSNMNEVIIALNLTHKDEVKREIYNNKLFRQALSVGINRQEIIDTLYLGLGAPHQAAPRPESELYDEEMATQFTAFDVEQANAWLDEAGYERGADGFRVGPDGESIVIAIETSQDGVADAVELIVRYWNELGIQANLNIAERSLLRERTDNNDHDVIAWNGEGGLGSDVLLDPRWYLPYSGWSFFGIPWQNWRNDPENPVAEEPPAEVQRQIELYEQIQSTADAEEQNELMSEVLGIAKEQFYVIGISLPPNSVGIAKNNFFNTSDTLYSSFNWPQPGPIGPEQFFIGEE